MTDQARPAVPSPVAQKQIIPTKGPVHRWIEPWYAAHAVLGALASGFAVILIPLVVSGGGGSIEIGTAIAAQNIGALTAPLWGAIADRSKAYRSLFSAGFCSWSGLALLMRQRFSAPQHV